MCQSSDISIKGERTLKCTVQEVHGRGIFCLNEFFKTLGTTYCIPGNISVRFIIANLAWEVSRYFIQHTKAEIKSFPAVYDIPILRGYRHVIYRWKALDLSYPMTLYYQRPIIQHVNYLKAMIWYIFPTQRGPSLLPTHFSTMSQISVDWWVCSFYSVLFQLADWNLTEVKNPGPHTWAERHHHDHWSHWHFVTKKHY